MEATKQATERKDYRGKKQVTTLQQKLNQKTKIISKNRKTCLKVGYRNLTLEVIFTEI